MSLQIIHSDLNFHAELCPELMVVICLVHWFQIPFFNSSFIDTDVFSCPSEKLLCWSSVNGHDLFLSCQVPAGFNIQLHKYQCRERDSRILRQSYRDTSLDALIIGPGEKCRSRKESLILYWVFSFVFLFCSLLFIFFFAVLYEVVLLFPFFFSLPSWIIVLGQKLHQGLKVLPLLNSTYNYFCLLFIFLLDLFAYTFSLFQCKIRIQRSGQSFNRYFSFCCVVCPAFLKITIGSLRQYP